MFRTSHQPLGWFLLWTAGLALVIVASSSLASAQGLQTGIVTGIVQSTDQAPLPGVTVTASSPALQGKRTAVTAEVTASMKLAARTESVTVTAETPSPLATTTSSQAFKKADLDAMPVG